MYCWTCPEKNNPFMKASSDTIYCNKDNTGECLLEIVEYMERTATSNEQDKRVSVMQVNGEVQRFVFINAFSPESITYVKDAHETIQLLHLCLVYRLKSVLNIVLDSKSWLGCVDFNFDDAYLIEDLEDIMN